MRHKHKRLKAAAHELDRRLRGVQKDGSHDPRFRTLVHGDFKSANLLFSARAPVSCAAFDFQYCGEGEPHRCCCYLICQLFFTPHILCSISWSHVHDAQMEAVASIQDCEG